MKTSFTHNNEKYQQVPDDQFDTIRFSEEKLYQIALTYVFGIGDILIKQLISYCGSASAIFKTPKARLLKIPGIGEKTATSILESAYLSKAEKELNLALKNNIQLLFFTDKNFPDRLKQISDSPILLYYKGNADLNSKKIISIVGTRNSTEYGKQFTYQFIQEIKKINPLIVSGLAYGIDIAVHKACLENDIPTIGVMGTGLDIIYPAIHKSVAQQMSTNGGILTEFPFGTKPDKQNFPARNRIVAGIADATIIVEAAVGGGALITAEIANSYNKDVFAVPGSVYAKYSEGCNNLIKSNKACLITSAKDFIEAMIWDKEVTPQNDVFKVDENIDLNPEELTIIKLLRENNEMQIDDISWKSQLPINKIASLLLTLEFQGLVKALPGKKFKLK